MKHGAVDDSERQISRAAATGVEHHFIRADDSLVVVADAPIGAEIVALAGDGKIVVAVEPHLAGLTGMVRGERGQSRPLAGLALLAAEAAAHPACFDCNESVGNGEDTANNMLHLGWILRGGMDREFATFAGNGKGGLAFEIEMLLAADIEFAVEPMRRLSESLGDIAAAEFIIGQHSRAIDYRFVD